ncbi:MAG: RICIN domain-containing protein [Atopobium sp.]|nr:RICIN domain-containing protein [Atopobium sp.]
MAYSPKNELAFRLGMAVTLSATLVCATPAFAAEAQTSSSTAQQTQASTAAVTETAQDASTSSTTPAATTASTEEAVSSESEATTETKQSAAVTAATTGSSTKKDQTAASEEHAASLSSAEASDAESSSSNTESAASESQPTSTAETSEKSADSNDSTASNGASDTETSTPTASAESDSAATTASEAANTTAAASAKVALSANVETEEKTELDGIDISGYQKGIDIAAVPSDFVIVKVSEGTDSTATFKEQADAALKAGKLLGLYHFANADTTASAQAEFFADSVKDYLGKALLFLDWEDTSYSKVREKGTSWAAEWLERVYRLTGVKPLIYMNKNATREYDFTEIAKEYKLWAAQYADMDTHDGYQDDPWQDTKGYGAWGSAPTILQYSSMTHLDGYDGNLDVDKFYGTKEDWEKLAAVDSSAVVAPTTIADGLYEISSLLVPNADIEVSGGDSGNGARIQNWSANDTAAQRWRVKKQSDGTYTIINARTGKSLDIPGASAYASQRVQQYTFNGTNAQRWYIEEDVLHPGSYVIESALNRSLVFDVRWGNKNNGTAIQLYDWNGSLAQLFSFKALNQLVADGVYTIKNEASQKVLDVNGASLDSMANVQQYSSNGTYAQKFEISYDRNDGYYTIMNVQSGRVLDIENGSWDSGANVWQYSPNGTYAQKWAIKQASDGSYQIISSLNSLALDVEWASSASGANVWVYGSNGTEAQRWTFENIKDWLKEGSYQIVSELNHDNAMAVSRSSTVSGAPIYTRVREDGNTAQAWYITKTSDGYVRLTNVGSGLVLDLDGAAAANGTKIQQYASNGSDAQQWKVVLANNGFKLVSKVNSNYVIDILNGNSESFATVQSYADNGTAAQRWHLVVFDPLASGRQFEIMAEDLRHNRRNSCRRSAASYG